MPNAPVRLLVTGFGPFPGVPDNASAGFAHMLADAAGKFGPAVEATAAVLPTEWDSAPSMLHRLIAEYQPGVCLHLGVSGTARDVIVETLARNTAALKPDATGKLPARGRLIEEAPAMLLPARSPLQLVSEAMRAGLPVRPSLRAGNYLCNAIYFHSLWLMRQRRPPGGLGRQVAFLHLPVRVGVFGRTEPSGPTAEPLSLDLALRSAMRILGSLCAPEPSRAEQAAVASAPTAAR